MIKNSKTRSTFSTINSSQTKNILTNTNNKDLIHYKTENTQIDFRLITLSHSTYLNILKQKK